MDSKTRYLTVTDLLITASQISVSSSQCRFLRRSSFVPGGAALLPLLRLDGCILVALDGTQTHSSDKIHCPSCSSRQTDSRPQSKTQYFHTMLGAAVVGEELLCRQPLCRLVLDCGTTSSLSASRNPMRASRNCSMISSNPLTGCANSITRPAVSNTVASAR